MAHELEIKDGQASLFLLEKSAWHGLGTVVQKPVVGNISGEEVIKTARQDWEVHLEPIRCTESNTLVEDKFAVVRSDNKVPLGVVGKEYTIFQNREMYGLCSSLGEWMENLIYESAGVLGKGEIVWTLIRMGDAFKLGGDEIYPYLLVVNSHDGTKNLIIIPTTIRVVCKNTLNMALPGKGKKLNHGFKIMHTNSIHERANEAKKAYVHCSNSWKATQNVVTQMVEKRADEEMVESFIKDCFKETDSKRSKTVGLERKESISTILNSPTSLVDGTTGSLYSLMNACTEFLEHQSTFHSKVDGKQVDISQSKFISTQLGNISKKKALIWETACDYLVGK